MKQQIKDSLGHLPISRKIGLTSFWPIFSTIIIWVVLLSKNSKAGIEFFAHFLSYMYMQSNLVNHYKSVLTENEMLYFSFVPLAPLVNKMPEYKLISFIILTAVK